MADIKQINICIARHYCNIIHSKLVGQVKNGVNRHIFYANLVEEYINRQYKSPKLLMENLQKITSSYCESTNDIITPDMLVDDFVLNYSYPPVYEKLEYLQKIEIYNSIIYKALISYIKWLHGLDEKMFFGIELSDEQKVIFKNKLIELIKLDGAIAKYEIYNPNNEVVPKKLFLELKEQYNRLKKQLAE